MPRAGQYPHRNGSTRRRLGQLFSSSVNTSASSRTRGYRTPFERTLLIARRNIVLLLICFLVLPLAALAYSRSQTTEYTASASLLFSENAPQIEPGRAAATNLALATSEQVILRTVSALPAAGLTPAEVDEKVTANPVGESDLIDISATDPSPAFAARLANVYARQFIAFRADTANGSARANHVQIAQPALPPSSPSSPKTTRNVALGILLGVLLGISLALLREQFDRRLKDLDDAEAVFDLPVLATVPERQRAHRWNPRSKVRPGPEEAETFRMLRANLQYFNVDRSTKSIAVTSPAPQDGKTTVSLSLARAEAHAQKSVLLLEADLRRPTLAPQLGADPDRSLSLVLAGMMEPAEATQTIDGVDTMIAGPIPPNPAELIDSERMRQLLEWADDTYDRIIIDTPPVAVVADAVPLVRQVDGTLVVVRLRSTPYDAAQHLQEQLTNTGAALIGMVVNGAAPRKDNSYYRMPVAIDSFPKPLPDSATARPDGAAKPTRNRRRT